MNEQGMVAEAGPFSFSHRPQLTCHNVLRDRECPTRSATTLTEDVLRGRRFESMLGTQDFKSEHDDVYHWGCPFSQALTIGVGTSEVQRRIIGERLLGLPREPKPTAPTGKSTR